MSLPEQLLELAERGLASGAKRLPEAIDRGQAWAKEQELAGLPEFLEALRPAAPSLAGLAEGELRALLGRAHAEVEGGDPGLGRLTYEERRERSRQITAEARAAGELRESRLVLLGEILEGLGDAAKVVIPVVLAAL